MPLVRVSNGGSSHYVLSIPYYGFYYNGRCGAGGSIKFTKDITSLLEVTLPEASNSGSNTGATTTYTNTWSVDGDNYEIRVQITGGNWDGHYSYAGTSPSNVTLVINGNTVLDNVAIPYIEGANRGFANGSFLNEFMY